MVEVQYRTDGQTCYSIWTYPFHGRNKKVIEKERPLPKKYNNEIRKSRAKTQIHLFVRV